MMRNILDDIWTGKMSEEVAYDLIDEVLDSDEVDIAQLLCFTSVEWTAYGHGLPLAEIARWRYLGWPSSCNICGRFIDVEKFGWVATMAEGGAILKHIACLE